MIAYTGLMDSPTGPFRVAVDEYGRVIAAQFEHGDYPVSLPDELSRLGYRVECNSARVDPVRHQVDQYTNRTRTTFDVPLQLAGSPWQQRVWQALVTIPCGETRTYGQLARELGHPRSSRAVGRANATNPIPLIVPCHRLIGADGSLTGYAGGIHLKRQLLDHERFAVTGL